MEEPTVSFPAGWRDLSVALCHDWLTGMRGGERVLELLCRGFPRAPVYTLIHNAAAVSPDINCHEIRTSRLQKVPGIFGRYRHLLPLFPLAVRGLGRPKEDLLISTSHCVAKALRTRRGARHLCYCFTPMRYAWTFHDEYLGRGTAKRLAARPILAALREWDRSVSKRVDRFVAISRHVRRRIEIFYGREADVVYPPVDTSFFTPGPPGHDGFDLIVSALVPYKRVDLAVRAYTETGHPLKIVGTGTEMESFKAAAGPNIEWLGWQPDDVIRDLYRRCRLLVFPGEEDFGIVPVEAQACGKPVVAYAKGGVMESIVPGRTGIAFEEQTVEGLQVAVRACAERAWDSAAIRRNAERFGLQPFIEGLDRSIRACMGGG
jgi:glycosyltransferase involved in cell wall biosynthesis